MSILSVFGNILGVLLSIIFVGLYIIAPLLIKANLIKPFRPEFIAIESIELAGDNLPYQNREFSDLSDLFHDSAEPLTSLGFVLLGNVRHPIPKTGQDSFVSIWTNRETTESVQLITVITPVAGVAKRRDVLVAFRTEFTDGSAIVTSNSKSVGCFPRDPLVDNLRLRQVADLLLLHKVHSTRSLRLQGNRMTTLDRVKDPPSRLLDEHQSTFARLVKLGYFKINEGNETYVPTLKGAYLMTYRLLFPFKQIQNFQKDRSALAELRRLSNV